jgi:lysophospholipase L1-like esterase
VAALGDSITAGSPLWDPNPAVRAQFGDSVSPASQYEYWAQKALGPKATIRNCGVFGERTDQIARRLDSCVRGVDLVVIQGGINDIAQGRSPTAAATSLRGMVQAAKRKQLHVVLVNILPWNRGYPGAAPLVTRLNTAIARIGQDERVPVVDFYKALEDPARPGRMPAAMTTDGNHPTVPGYRVLGELLAKELRVSGT